MLASLKKFLAAAEGSVLGHINAVELYRSIVTSLGAGSGLGLVISVLTFILGDVNAIFPNPAVAGLATALITLVIDLLRRQGQDGKPTPAPAPAPPPGGPPAPTPTPAA